MAGEGLTVVEEEKDIGVTVSSSLKPSKHCQKVAATANAVLRQLQKISITETGMFSKNYMYNMLDHMWNSPHLRGRHGQSKTKPY